MFSPVISFKSYGLGWEFLIDKEITLGDVIWPLSEERKVIFVIDSLFIEPIVLDSLTGSISFVVFSLLLFSIGLKVSETKEAF